MSVAPGSFGFVYSRSSSCQWLCPQPKNLSLREMSTEVQRIGVLTSGGDSPGMNAAIRAVVRSTLYYKKVPFAIYSGYHGMMEGDIKQLESRDVGNIINRGGTILKSSRSEEFRTEAGRARAAVNLKKHGIDAVVVIGGDGTYTGALKLSQEHGIHVVGIPGTIDNDLAGTDYTLGFDTATNTAVEAIDKIRDTASSHSRLFFVEVMGRDAGFIAVRSALATGAEAVVIPEKHISVENIVKKLESGSRKNKTSALVIVAEAGNTGRTLELAAEVTKQFKHYDYRVTILGHLQRGGSPSCFDRVLAGRFGVGAVEAILAGKNQVAVGIRDNNISYCSLQDAIQLDRNVDDEVFRVAKILSY